MVDLNQNEKMSYLFTAEKAGMQGLNREEINKIITEATKNSRMSKKNQEDLERMKEDAEKTIQLVNAFHKNEILYNQIKQLADAKIHQIRNERRLDKIWVHIDMDMFFAQVEIRDDPSLANIPMAVGSTAMISTSNYIARKFGVRSAMPGFLALRLCPTLKIVPGDFHKYSRESKKIMSVVEKYDPNYEQMGCDEAYIDLTSYCSEKKATTETEVIEIVKQIKKEIYDATLLTCSCGIACNKTLAKICSDYNKPNGIYYLKFEPETIENFVKELNIRKIPFIGQKTEQRLNLIGIYKCKDLLERYIDLFYLYDETRFEFFISSALGIGSYFHSEVQEEAKSISRGESFRMTSDLTIIKEKFIQLAKKVFKDMQRDEVLCKTLSIETIDLTERKSLRCQTRDKEYDSEDDIINVGWSILTELLEKGKKIRMIRVKVSGLSKVGSSTKQVEENSILKWIDNLKDQPIREQSRTAEQKEDKKKSEKRRSVSIRTVDIIELLKNMRDAYNPNYKKKENVEIKRVESNKKKTKNNTPKKKTNRTLDSFLNRTI